MTQRPSTLTLKERVKNCFFKEDTEVYLFNRLSKDLPHLRSENRITGKECRQIRVRLAAVERDEGVVAAVVGGFDCRRSRSGHRQMIGPVFRRGRRAC